MPPLETHSQMRSEEIKNYARANVASYVTARDKGGTHWWRSIESLSGQVAQEYQGRVLYELIQNASDAHSRAGSPAPVKIRFDKAEGEFGVLYISNGGRPFTRVDFESINSIAQSSKPPGEGIGNKGLGFRSVLIISAWPEIYSSEPDAELDGNLSGYCFGFARPEDVLDLCGNDQDLADSVQNDIHPMLLPTPRGSIPRAVKDLVDGQTVTVIRLPLRSEGAARSIETQIEHLLSDKAPLLLFLNQISHLTVEITDGRAIDLAETLSRSTRKLDLESDVVDSFELIDLQEKGKFFSASVSLRAETLREKIRESIKKGYMDDRWLDWKESSFVSVACRIDGEEGSPKIFTFLPMAETAPFAGYLNAPFFTALGRVGLQLDVPFNEFLFSIGAKSCAAAAIALSKSVLAFAPSCAVDLVAWDDDHAESLEEAFDQLGLTLMDASIIPTEHPKLGIVWASIEKARRWDFSGNYVSSEKLTTLAGAQLLPETLGEARTERLHQFFRKWQNEGLDPSGYEKGIWFEKLASDLSQNRADMSVWDRYYDDLAGVFRFDAECLAGRLILIDSEGTCAPVAESSSTKTKLSRISVFFPPVVGVDEEDEDETDESVDLSVPSVLKDRIRFMHSDLTWRERDGRTVTKLPRRRFLEDNKLVRLFRRSDVLEILAAALASSSNKRVHLTCLRWAYELFRSSSSSRGIDLRDIPFRIPCAGGLKLAKEAIFSVGWGTEDAQDLETLLTDASDFSPDLAKLQERLIEHPKNWPFEIGNMPIFREFLEAAGVRDGLWPDVTQTGPVRATGTEFYNGSFLSELGLSRADRDFWWEAVKADWSGPSRPQAKHILEGDLSRIPGQTDYEHFPDSARMRFAILIARGLARWSNRDFNVVVRRVYGGESPLIWVTPLGAFLKLASWVPVARVGDRHSVDYVAPSDAWHCSVRSADPPAFSPYVHHSVRAALQDDNQALRRFREAGGHDWLDPDDAPSLVRHLTRIYRDIGLQQIHRADFRATYENAWRECMAPEPRNPFSDEEDGVQVIAQMGDQLVLVPDSSGDSNLYVDAGVDPVRTAIISLLDWPILQLGPERHEEPSVSRERETLLTDLLSESLDIEVRRLSDVNVEILADGEVLKPIPDSGRKLIDENTEGLSEIVLVYFALEWSGGTRSRRLFELENLLRRIRLVTARQISVRVDEHEVELPPSLGGVLSLGDPDTPLLVAQIGEQWSDTELIPRLSYQLATLIGAKSYADGLARVLYAVPASTFQHGLSMFSETQLSELLRVPVSRISEIANAFRGRQRYLAFLVKPALAFWIGVSRAAEQFDFLFREEGPDDLHAVLVSVETELPISVKDLIEICRRVDSPWEIRDELGLDFEKFNSVLAELGPPYEPQKNVDEHQLVFAEYVQLNRARIEDSLRRASLGVFDSGNLLSDYALQRILKSLEPDPDWLMVCARPTDELMRHRINAWLSKQGAKDLGDKRIDLLPLSQVLGANRRALGDLLKELPLIAAAWFQKVGKTVEAPWDNPDPRDAIASAVEESGVLDFRPLEETSIVTWMNRLSLWPTGMLLSTDLETLGLEPEDIDRLRSQAESTQANQRRAKVSLLLDGEHVSFEESGAAEIIRRLDESLDTDRSILPRTIADLQEQSEDGKKGRREKPPGGGPGHPNQSMSEEQRNLIGFIGEWIAFRALQQTYGINYTNWISSNRARRVDGEGTNDTAGYDFFVDTPTGPLYFEVKATIGDEGFIRLGQTEMDFAQRHADRRESYRILHVTHALDSSKRQMLRLPNPFGPRGRGRYRLRQGALQLYFRLAGGVVTLIDEGARKDL